MAMRRYDGHISNMGRLDTLDGWESRIDEVNGDVLFQNICI